MASVALRGDGVVEEDLLRPGRFDGHISINDGRRSDKRSRYISTVSLGSRESNSLLMPAIEG